MSPVSNTRHPILLAKEVLLDAESDDWLAATSTMHCRLSGESVKKRARRTVVWRSKVKTGSGPRRGERNIDVVWARRKLGSTSLAAWFKRMNSRKRLRPLYSLPKAQ